MRDGAQDALSAGTVADDDADATWRAVRTLHTAVKDAAFVGAEGRERRRGSFEALVAELGQLLPDHRSLVVELGDYGFRVDGYEMPAALESLELSRLFRSHGLRAIHLRGPIVEAELRQLVVALGEGGPGPASYRGQIYRKLLGQDFECLSFSLMAGAIHPARGDGADEPSTDEASERFWNEEILREERRNLPLELARAAIEDIERDPRRGSYRKRVIQLLQGLCARLVHANELHSALSLLDLAEHSPGVEHDDIDELLRCLDEFRREPWLRHFLRSLPPTPGPSVAAFLMRLGPELTPLLLSEAASHRSAALHTLLETLVQLDSAPFYAALESDDEETLSRALTYLDGQGLVVPGNVLEKLSSAESDALRTQAIRILVERQPDRVPTGRALRLLYDESQAIRSLAMQRLAEVGDESSLDHLRDWFAENDRDLQFTERKTFFLTFAALAGPVALPFLVDWITSGGIFRRRSSDRANRFCSIFALGEIDCPEARALLDDLSCSKNEAIQEAARQARRA